MTVESTPTGRRAFLSAEVDEKTKEELERRAKLADRSISAEVRRALRFYLENTQATEAAA